MRTKSSFVKTILAVMCLFLLAALPAAAAEPVKGGDLKVAFNTSSPKETLDPAKITSNLEYAAATSIYNSLVGVSTKLELVPELAESWVMDEKTGEWTFNLRQGVKWHDGKDFTSADAVYTFKRLMDPATGSPAKSVLDAVTGVSADGPHKLKFQLKDINVDFPYFLTDWQMKLIQDGAKEFAKPVGTGPFMVEEFKPGIRTSLVKNQNYWKNGLPHLDKMELFAITDPMARFSALVAGDVDLMINLDSKMIQKAEATENIEVFTAPSGYHVLFVMNTTVAPYDNPDVRKALKMLFDREQYGKIVYKGYAVPGNDNPVHPGDQFYCKSLEPAKYQPKEAKKLLEKAGYADHTFKLYTGENLYGGVDGAMVFQRMAARAGVKVEVVRAPSDSYWSAVWMKKPFCMSQWGGRATANLMLSVAYRSDAAWNDTFWKRPEFDKLLNESQHTTDMAKRKEIACNMQKMLKDDGGVIIPVFINWVDAKSKKVKGIIAHPIYGLGGLRFGETAWLEK